MPFVVELNLSFMRFLVTNATYSHIRLIIECHFWHSGGITTLMEPSPPLPTILHLFKRTHRICETCRRTFNDLLVQIRIFQNLEHYFPLGMVTYDIVFELTYNVTFKF